MSQPQQLAFRWLVPPEVSQQPPLAAPVALAVSPAQQRVYLLELQPPELRVYSTSDGRIVDRLGRSGDGPGEYRYPRSLSVNANGIAAVLSMSGRVTFWDATGRLLSTRHVAGGLASEVLAARGDTFIVKTDIFPPDDVAEFRLVTPDTVLRGALFRDGGVPGTEQPGQLIRNHAYAVAATPRGELLLAPPGPDYLILRIGSDGRPVQEIRRREVPALRRSQDEIEELRREVQKGFAAAGRAAPRDFHVPELRSHILRLSVSPDGSILALTGRGTESVAIIDVFDGAGEYTRSLGVILRVVDLAATTDAIYFLARSRLDLSGIAVSRWPGARIALDSDE